MLLEVGTAARALKVATHHLAECADHATRPGATWSTTCTGEIAAKARDCTSTADNNCNGTPDKNEASCVCPAGTAQSCDTGKLGSCKAGSQTCNASSDKTSTSWGACTGPQASAADGCNPKNDANCDGTVGGGCCATGQASCSGSCYNLQTDAKNCGACGKACAQGQTCSAGTCRCTLGASVCSSCLGWTFEAGTQNWIKDSDPNESAYGGGVWNGAQSPVTSTALVCPAGACSGSAHSLQVSLALDNSKSISNAGVAVSVCQSGATVDFNGRTITVHGFLAPDAGFGDIGVLSLLRADAWSPSGVITCPLVWGTQMASNAWFTGTCTFGESFQANHLAIVLILSGSPWTGKMYLDDVQVN
ncbi:MAG TPA: hypothetical protein VN764_04660 [Polyangiaceae bacterium]|nr:hypothetical protein [Polyangiaceae bacterium]